MAFEIREKDLLGRIGRLTTKSGMLETPTLLPVVNPRIVDIPPRQLYEEFGYQGIITNAYILKKYFEAEAVEVGMHRFLNYPGVVMTDSGAYQILRYGKVTVEPLEIVDFQRKIGSDIAVILDIPTGWDTPRSRAEWTVKETVRRAREAAGRLGNGMLWVGPVQGGRFLDLVEYSAKRMKHLPYDIFALGSPTEVMEQYLFEVLVDMVMTAKFNLPIQKPLHLFGAGHPFLFSFAVAMGCDLFDSASYALYAREDRYMTENGTIRLEHLKYFPCACPACWGQTPEELKTRTAVERKRFLMRHNLYICKAELDRVKQAIVEGRLWELLELRARSHPALFRALHALTKHASHFEEYTPTYKPRGIFIFGETSLHRPEVTRHRKKMLKNYRKPRGIKILMLLPQVEVKPFHASPEYDKVKFILRELGEDSSVHSCFYTVPFGVVPLELDEVYPLSQYEVVQPFTVEMKRHAAEAICEYVKTYKYNQILLHPDRHLLGDEQLAALKGIGLQLTTKRRDPWSKPALEDLKEQLQAALAKRGIRSTAPSRA